MYFLWCARIDPLLAAAAVENCSDCKVLQPWLREPGENQYSTARRDGFNYQIYNGI